MSIMDGLATGLLTTLVTLPWISRAIIGAVVGALLFVALPPLFRIGTAADKKAERDPAGISADRGSVAIGGQNNTVYYNPPAQPAAPNVSFQKYALFWVRTDPTKFQVGIIAKLFNVDNNAHLIQGIVFLIESNTFQAHGVKYLMQRETVFVDREEILEDNFIKPATEGYYKKLLPLYIELTMEDGTAVPESGSRPPEVKLNGVWKLKFENREIPVRPNFAATYDQFISPQQWDDLMRPRSTIKFDELDFRSVQSAEHGK